MASTTVVAKGNGVYSGVLKRIGSGVVINGALTSASVIEIGEETLRNIKYSNFIDTYLRDAIESDQPVELCIVDHQIYGIRINGKTYYDEELPRRKFGIGPVIGILIGGLSTFGILLLLFPILWVVYQRRNKVMTIFERLS